MVLLVRQTFNQIIRPKGLYSFGRIKFHEQIIRYEMNGPQGPNLFILLFFYNRYKKRFYKKNGNLLTNKQPLSFFGWFFRLFLRVLGVVLAVLMVFTIASALIK